MTLNYRFYEELLRRKHRGANCWLIGAYLDYLEILVALAGLLVGFAWLVSLDFGELGLSAWWVLLFPGGVLVFVVSSGTKGYSYELERRDGISNNY